MTTPADTYVESRENMVAIGMRNTSHTAWNGKTLTPDEALALAAALIAAARASIQRSPL